MDGDSGVASPKKVGGPNHVSLLVSRKSYNIYLHGVPPVCQKTFFDGFGLIPRGVWTEVGGPDPATPPPWRRHWMVRLYWIYWIKSIKFNFDSIIVYRIYDI